MAQDPAGKILAKNVDSSNFKDYVQQEGFTQWANLEEDWNSGDLSYDDIMGMNDEDLEKMLVDDYNVKVAQKRRFIRAVATLSNSQASGM